MVLEAALLACYRTGKTGAEYCLRADLRSGYPNSRRCSTDASILAFLTHGRIERTQWQGFANAFQYLSFEGLELYFAKINSC